MLTLIAGLAIAAPAQVWISEALINPPGSPDAGREFIELRSCQPNWSLQGVWIIGIDGESLFNPGNIHWAIDLSAYSTGSNGLILIRDASRVLLPEPDPATTVVVITEAFTPAGMQNDSYTVAVVRNFRGQPNDDIDQDNDGVIDNVLWDEAYDAIGWLDGETASGEVDQVYSVALGGIEVPVDARRDSTGDVWEPDAYVRFNGDNWIACDVGRLVSGQNQGPFGPSSTQRYVNGTVPPDFDRLTPGSANPGTRPPQVGDVDCTGCVDDADLLAVLFAFGQSGDDLPEDVDSDGVVDDADLLLVLFNFGQGC